MPTSPDDVPAAGTGPVSDFYAKPEPEPLGDPALDPPMTVRVHPDDNPRDPKALRVIKTDEGDGAAWFAVTGGATSSWLRDADVADWPVSHRFLYSVAFRHAEAAAARRGQVAQAADRGDMDVDSFRGGA